MWLDQYEFAGFYAAKEKGFYKEAGLEVEFKKYTIDTNIVSNVLEEQADFGTGSSSLIVDKSLGRDIVLLGSIFQSSPLILLGLKDNGIKTINDIKNKRVMLTEDQQRFATLQSMLASKNVQLTDIKIQEHSFNVDDLINKKTDLILAYTTNEPYVLKEKGYDGIIFHPKDYGFDFYELLIFTSNKFAQNNPELVKRFYKATIKGWEYAFENIPEIAKLTYEKYNPQNKTLESLIYEAVEMKKLVYDENGKIGTITKERLRLIDHSYRILGLLKSTLNIDDLIYKGVTTNSLELTPEEKSYLVNKKKITMCIDPDWMPFEKNDNGKHIGMSADYFELLQKEIKIPIVMVPTKTWTQSLEYGKSRKCDIFSLVMTTPERETYLNFTKAYLEVPLVIASQIDAPFINDITQVKNQTLGIVKGYAYGEILRLKYPNIHFIEVTNINDGLQKVKEKKIYGFIGSLATVGYHIQKEYIGQIKIAGKFDETWKLGIGTRNDEATLHTIFNKAIDSISYETRQTILNKWVSVNYDRGIDYKFFSQVLLFGVILTIIIVLLYRQYLLKDLNKRLNEKVRQEVEKNNQQHHILAQQTKMAAMGEMIGNIAHQWRQPLSVITVAASGMQFQKEHGQLNDEEFNSSIESIKTTANFLSETIDDFRNFFSVDKSMHMVNISQTFDKAFELISAQFKNKEIIIVKEVQPIELLAYENELIQVFINIFNNAKDALKNKKSEKYIFVNAHKEENKLIISICDNAGGIDTPIIEKVFEPYFTTKHQFQGTGIGLYMSEQMITQHMKGTIKVENKQFEYRGTSYIGANFIIVLPIIET